MRNLSWCPLLGAFVVAACGGQGAHNPAGSGGSPGTGGNSAPASGGVGVSHGGAAASSGGTGSGSSGTGSFNGGAATSGGNGGATASGGSGGAEATGGSAGKMVTGGSSGFGGHTSAGALGDGGLSGGLTMGGGGGGSGFGGDNGGSGGADAGTCGDGRLEFEEDCDDGNLLSGDGCTSACEVEAGFQCNDNGCFGPFGDPFCPSDSCRIGNTCLANPSHMPCKCSSTPQPRCETPIDFRPLPMPLDGTSCDASDLSDDATTIVGSCAIWGSSDYAAVWHIAGTSSAETVGSEPYDGQVAAVSADGSRVIGSSLQNTGFIYDLAAASKAAELPATFPAAISADGRVVAGYDPLGRGFRWTASGTVTIEEDNASVYPEALSADGAVLVGSVLLRTTDIAVWRAMRWNASGVGTPLPLPSGAEDARAMDVSGDGALVVGTARMGSAGETHAVRWTKSGIDTVSDTPESRGSKMSADGSRIVGYDSEGPWVWDQTTGKHYVRDVLADLGVSAMWSIRWVSAISGDGKHLVGSATHSEPRPTNASRAFILRLPF